MYNVDLSNVARADLGITFDRAFRDESTRDIVVRYIGKHQHPETLKILDFTVELRKEPKRYVASVNFENCEASDAAGAFKRLAEWCVRAAETLEKFGEEEKDSLPI